MIKFIILGIALLIALLIYLFPIYQISGNSMYPTLKDRQLVLCKRFGKIQEDKIYVFRREDRYVVKRLLAIRNFDNDPLFFTGSGDFCYFVGDNPSESYDSRDYGYIAENQITAQVIKIIKK